MVVPLTVRRMALSLALLLLAGPLAAQSSGPGSIGKPAPGIVRVRIVTALGPIVLALDARHAPLTTANFLAYVDDGRFDGTTFYRAARGKATPTKGFIQGGIDTDAHRILPSFPLETTIATGIKHLDGSVSMARGDRPDSAGGNFTISVGATPQMDGRPGYPGYAAFGHVIAGMDTVRRILALPSGGGFDAMKGQMIFDRVRLIRAERLDGVAHPSGRPKVWLILQGR